MTHTASVASLQIEINDNVVFFLHRPSDSEIAMARKAKLKDKMTAFIIKDIGTYLIFILIVSKLAYSEKDPNMFQYRRDLVNMFHSSHYTNGPSLGRVRTRF